MKLMIETLYLTMQMTMTMVKMMLTLMVMMKTADMRNLNRNDSQLSQFLGDDNAYYEFYCMSSASKSYFSKMKRAQSPV